MDLHAYANYLEAGLWVVIGGWFAVSAVSAPDAPRRRLCALAATAFIAFGGSDVVEVQTGAWWRPWWLFAWKAACVAGFLGLWRVHKASR